MKKSLGLSAFLILLLPAFLAAGPVVQTTLGKVEGTQSSDGQISVFRGIPYAAPPVGKLRWKSPQEAKAWQGVLPATEFGFHPMQPHVWDDIIFRDKGMSEDCLTLNIWAPGRHQEPLPVMVWIYGGGFAVGGSSEARQDGEELARKQVVVVSMNYRLGIFGFFTHPELSQESGGSSGNYGLMDQAAALRWVKRNIAAFGGDPDKVTIFGESAGSFSVSAHMASPMSRGLFQRAIGQSGAYFGGVMPDKALAEAEKVGQDFSTSIQAPTLKALRNLSATALLAATGNQHFRFGGVVDGAFLKEPVQQTFAQGLQAKVPLLAGWNLDEGSYQGVFKGLPPTVANFRKLAKESFGDKADAFLKVYQAKNSDEAKRAAQDLAGDYFLAHATWKWLEAQATTGNVAVYRYRFDQAGPGKDSVPHASDIVYTFGVKDPAWRPEDLAVSGRIMSYWSNFARSGDPNGPGLPKWPLYSAKTGWPVMHLGGSNQAEQDPHRKRHEFLNSLEAAKK